MITKIDEFIGRAFKTATEHGFHDEKTSFEHQMELVIGEISEAVEADRKNRHANLAGFDLCVGIGYPQRFKDYVKDTVEDEMADICIRLFDMCGYFKLNPWRANEEILTLRDDWKREFDKMRFCEQAYALTQLLCACNGHMPNVGVEHIFGSALTFIHYWSLSLNIDLVRHIELKMQYNESRGYKHGKKY